jgi:hypothetical protein
MGKQLTNQNERIVQRSIGFNLRQILFFNEHPDFKPDVFCRKAIDEQIKLIDEKYGEKGTN